MLKQQTTKILDTVLASHHINIAKTLPMRIGIRVSEHRPTNKQND